MLGIQFTETMSGTYRSVAEPAVEGRMSFTITVRGRWLLHGRFDAEGTIDVEGIATGRPARGSLFISPVLSRVLRYDLEFTGDDQRRYSFGGQKDLELFDLRRTITTLPGQLIDEGGQVVGDAQLYFDFPGDLLPFLTSFRPA